MSLKLSNLKSQINIFKKENSSWGKVVAKNISEKVLLLEYWILSEKRTHKLKIIADGSKKDLIAEHEPPLLDPQTGQVSSFEIVNQFFYFQNVNFYFF